MDQQAKAARNAGGRTTTLGTFAVKRRRRRIRRRRASKEEKKRLGTQFQKPRWWRRRRRKAVNPKSVCRQIVGEDEEDFLGMQPPDYRSREHFFLTCTLSPISTCEDRGKCEMALLGLQLWGRFSTQTFGCLKKGLVKGAVSSSDGTSNREHLDKVQEVRRRPALLHLGSRYVRLT